jgi:hypothetical protein
MIMNFLLGEVEVGQVFLVVFYAVCDRAAQNNERALKKEAGRELNSFIRSIKAKISRCLFTIYAQHRHTIFYSRRSFME